MFLKTKKSYIKTKKSYTKKYKKKFFKNKKKFLKLLLKIEKSAKKWESKDICIPYYKKKEIYISSNPIFEKDLIKKLETYLNEKKNEEKGCKFLFKQVYKSKYLTTDKRRMEKCKLCDFHYSCNEYIIPIKNNKNIKWHFKLTHDIEKHNKIPNQKLYNYVMDGKLLKIVNNIPLFDREYLINDPKGCIEGYWKDNSDFLFLPDSNILKKYETEIKKRESKNNKSPYPIPIKNKKQWKGKKKFLKLLTKLENKLKKNEETYKKYQGMSHCRICGKSNGSNEYILKNPNIRWPEGYRHYIEKHNVIPSKEFWDFITND